MLLVECDVIQYNVSQVIIRKKDAALNGGSGVKVLMIHAWDPNERSYRGLLSRFFVYPSLTLPTLIALLPDGLGIELDVCDERIQRLSIDKKRYDLVLISADTSSANRAYALSAEFRRRGAIVAMGGYHASALPNEALEHVDTVIVGAAENALPLFLREFAAGSHRRLYDDPDNDSAQMSIPARGAVSRKRVLSIPTIIADRGCVNRCQFCAIRGMWRSRPRPVGEVVDEIRLLRSKQLIFFDPNFFAPRAYAVELMDALRSLGVEWVCNATADLAFDEELLERAEASGCRGVLFGLESLNENSLQGVDKRFWHAGRYQDAVKRMHAHHINVNGCFVLGFDGDTEDELLRIPERVAELGLDMTRFSILTPLPNAKLFRALDAEGRILTKDWSKYNQLHAVYQPKHMSPARLEEIFWKTWKESYTYRRIWQRAWAKHNPIAMRLMLLGANVGFKYFNA